MPFYNVDGYGFAWYSEARARHNPLPIAKAEAAASVEPIAVGIPDGEVGAEDGPLQTFVLGPHPAVYKTVVAQP